jgi:elongation factor P
VRTGNVYDKTFRAGEKVETARVERKKMQFLYDDGSAHFFFMDNNSYDQVELTEDQVGGASVWLKEGEDVDVTMYQGELLGVEVAHTVIRKIERTDPGIRGDTATGGTKPAVVEGGATVQVPLFVNEGETIKIDTRNGRYLERA